MEEIGTICLVGSKELSSNFITIMVGDALHKIIMVINAWQTVLKKAGQSWLAALIGRPIRHNLFTDVLV